MIVSGRVNLFGSSSLVAEWMMFGVPLQHPLGFKEHPLEDADMSIFQSHGFYGISNFSCHPIGVYVSLSLRIQVCPKKGINYPYIPILRMGLEPSILL